MLRHAGIPILLVAVAMSACQGRLEVGGSPAGPDAGVTTPDPDPDPDPDPPATPLTAAEVELAFDQAVLAALGGDSAVTVVDTDASAVLEGSHVAAAGTVTFAGLRLDKAPFAVSGEARVDVRQQQAVVRFDGGTSGLVTSAGQSLGTIAADFPPLDEFAGDSVEGLLDLAVDCQGLDLQLGDVVTIDDTCTLSDGDGNVVAELVIDQLTIDLVALSVTGSLRITGPDLDAEVVFDGASAELIIDGQPAGSVDLFDLLGALF